MEIKVLASGSRGNAYLVSDGLTPLLLECGINFKDIQRGLNFRLSEVAGCLVSHEHQDHARAAKDVAKAGIDIYASPGTLHALGLWGYRGKPVRAREQFTVGTWTVLPFETEHDAAEPLGFLLASRGGEKLLYATDTCYIRYRFRGLTRLMVECNYAADVLRANVESGAVPVEMKRRIIRSHMSLETLKEMLKANDLSRVQEIWLLHLSDNNSDAEHFKREIQALTGKPVYVA
jgi:phosphoribosyl 1,2-cyclic phosphodiesterase